MRKRGKMAKSKLNVPGVASLRYLSAGVITKLIGILTTPIFTRLLSTEDYGSFAFYLSVLGVSAGLISPLCSGGQLYSELKNGESSSNVFLSSLAPILGFCAILCIFLFTLSPVLNLGGNIILLILMQVFTDSAVCAYLAIERYFYHSRGITLLMATEAVSAPLISFILIKTFNIGFLGRCVGLLIPSVLIAFFIIVKSLIRGGRVEKNLSLTLARDSLPIIPSSVIGAFGGQIDRLLTAFLLGSGGIAKYSVAHSLGVGLYFVIAAISSALTPWMVRRLNSGEGTRIGGVIFTVGAGIGGASLILIGLSPNAMKILAPPEYSDALIAVIPIALSTLPAFYSSVCSAVLTHKRLGGKLTAIKLFSLSVGLLSGSLLIPTLGFLGAGLGVLFSELSQALLGSYFIKKITPVVGISPFSISRSLLLPCSIGLLFLLFSSVRLSRILLLLTSGAISLFAVFNSREHLFEKSAPS